MQIQSSKPPLSSVDDFFEAKRDQLYSVEIFYCVLLEGMRSKTGIGAGVARLITDPAGGLSELHSQFSNKSMKVLLPSQIQRVVLCFTSEWRLSCASSRTLSR